MASEDFLADCRVAVVFLNLLTNFLSFYARKFIKRNIAFAFVRLNKFAEASERFRDVLKEGGGTCTDAFHLLVCQYKLKDTVSLQNCFVRLLELAARKKAEFHR